MIALQAQPRDFGGRVQETDRQRERVKHQDPGGRPIQIRPPVRLSTPPDRSAT